MLANTAVIMRFLVFFTYSKHLHIFLAPLNVAFSRRPRALGVLGELPAAPGEAPGAGRMRSRPGTVA